MMMKNFDKFNRLRLLFFYIFDYRELL